MIVALTHGIIAVVQAINGSARENAKANKPCPYNHNGNGNAPAPK